MGVYHTMLDMGLIGSYRLSKGTRVDFDGTEVDCVLVHIDLEDNVITLHSEAKYSEEYENLPYTLERTFLHSLKLGSKKAEPKLQFSSIFSSGNSPSKCDNSDVQYDGNTNIVFTSEGIYYFKEELEKESDRRRWVRDIALKSSLYGMTEENRKDLEELGGVKIIEFTDNSDPELKLSIYNKLLARGAKEVYPLTFHQDRAKAMGHMYEGKGALELNGFTYYFEMWHHHKLEEHMTEEQVKDEIQLKGIRVGGEAVRNFLPDATIMDEPSYYQLSKSTFMFGNNIFFTPYKFSDESISGKRIAELKLKARVDGLTDEIISELKSMDFVKLL